MSGCLHYAVLVDRLILAALTGDEYDCDIIAADIGTEPNCWRYIAELLAERAALYLSSDFGTDKAIEFTASDIACDLDMLEQGAE